MPVLPGFGFGLSRVLTAQIPESSIRLTDQQRVGMDLIVREARRGVILRVNFPTGSGSQIIALAAAEKLGNPIALSPMRTLVTQVSGIAGKMGIRPYQGVTCTTEHARNLLRTHTGTLVFVGARRLLDIIPDHAFFESRAYILAVD